MSRVGRRRDKSRSHRVGGRSQSRSVSKSGTNLDRDPEERVHCEILLALEAAGLRWPPSGPSVPTLETIDVTQVVASNTDPGHLILNLLGEAAVGS